MSSYLLYILISFASMFLTCYFIYWFISLFNFKNTNKIALILITIDVLIHIIAPIENIVEYTKYVDTQVKIDPTLTISEVVSTYAQYAVYIIIDLCAYFTFIYLFYGNILTFKSERAKQFERSYNGKGNLLVHISRVLMSILSILCLALAIILFVTSKAISVIVVALFLIAISIVMVYLVVKSFIVSKTGVKTKVRQDRITNYYFIIISKYDTYLFSNLENKSFKEALNGLDDKYYIDEYGIINDGSKKLIYGIRLDDISDDDLNKISMNRVYNDKLINILSTLDKINQKIITVDSDYNIIDEKKR